MTVDAIKEAIAQLPEYERHALSGWLSELDYDTWDREMVDDFSPGGRGMALVDSIERLIAKGEAVIFEQGREQAQTESSRNRP